jgi:hypothetical protein
MCTLPPELIWLPPRKPRASAAFAGRVEFSTAVARIVITRFIISFHFSERTGKYGRVRTTNDKASALLTTRVFSDAVVKRFNFGVDNSQSTLAPAPVRAGCGSFPGRYCLGELRDDLCALDGTCHLDMPLRLAHDVFSLWP